MPSQLTSRLSHIGSSSREREIKANVYFSIRQCTSSEYIEVSNERAAFYCASSDLRIISL